MNVKNTSSSNEPEKSNKTNSSSSGIQNNVVITANTTVINGTNNNSASYGIFRLSAELDQVVKKRTRSSQKEMEIKSEDPIVKRRSLRLTHPDETTSTSNSSSSYKYR